MKDRIRSTTSKGQKVDVEALKEEIKKNIKKTRITHGLKELRVELDQRPTGFSLFISREESFDTHVP